MISFYSKNQCTHIKFNGEIYTLKYKKGKKIRLLNLSKGYDSIYTILSFEISIVEF